MLRSKELSYREPRFQAYNYTGIIGVVLSEYKCLENWYFNNCIQWEINKDGSVDSFAITALIPGMQGDLLEEKHFSGKLVYNSVDLIVRDLIDNDYYVNFWGIDDYYIPKKRHYESKHIYHDGLIVGYDDNNNTYSWASYNDSNHFSLFKTPQNCLSQAFNSHFIEHRNSLSGIKMKEKIVKVDLNYELILDSINNYLYPSVDNNKYYGIQIYDQLIRETLSNGMKFGYVDKRKMRLILEHKKCMLDRFKKLSQEIPEFNKVFENYLDIYNDAFSLQYLSVKYSITKKESYLNTMIELLKYLEQKEKNVLSELCI